MKQYTKKERKLLNLPSKKDVKLIVNMHFNQFKDEDIIASVASPTSENVTAADGCPCNFSTMPNMGC